ncbi:MAG: hypothetical protein II558_02515 [Treponema sp.]|nr:hypothetical protein [Treponema sp.]
MGIFKNYLLFLSCGNASFPADFFYATHQLLLCGLSGVPAFASIAGGSVGQSPLSPTGNGYAAPPIPAVLAIAHKIYSRGWFNTPMLCV